jgi:sugar phosphate isomerase/epimerase
VIKSAVTISLVPEARGGPFVFWDDLPAACRKAAEFGFDGVEVFAPDADAIRRGSLRDLLKEHGLQLAAAGTGAGWVKHKLTLTSPDPAVRQRAKEFIGSMIDAAGDLGAPAIVGSMQGRSQPGESKKSLREGLRDVLVELGERALRHRVPLLFEPLNRYETDLVNSVVDGWMLLSTGNMNNVRLLADLFHMNIEEDDPARALVMTKPWVGHVHFADSNRRPVGCGHTDFTPVAAALREIGYDGYVSAEALPYPHPEGAAELTIRAFREHFGGH